MVSLSEINLNDIVTSLENKREQAIQEAENKYFSNVLGAVDAILSKNKRIVLLSGPSGSGKTTTANFIREELEKRGHKTVLVSMDNFYRPLSDPLYPRDEQGEFDYEAVEALRCDRIHDCIEKITKGLPVTLPRYIFGEGRIDEEAYKYSNPEGGVFIMEGIHGLNPIFTKGIDEDRILRLFISVSTNINLDGKRLLSGRKVRFIRRMTRDSIYRKTGAEETLKRWQSVLRGEEKYLYPYRDTADFCFDTFHSFELSAMKELAAKAISEADKTDDFRGEFADIIRNALSLVPPLDTSLVPKTSLIREFISGGVFDGVY